MVNNIKITPEKEYFRLTFEFEFFNTIAPFNDSVLFETESGANSYLHQTKKQVFLHNFEKFVTTCAEHVKNDKQVTSINRLQAANIYFNETVGLTLQKICSMVIGVQNHLMAVMPGGKTDRYDEIFGWLNEIIKFAKNEVKVN